MLRTIWAIRFTSAVIVRISSLLNFRTATRPKKIRVELLFVCMHRSKLADSELVVKDDSDQRGIVATALLNN